MKIKLIDAMHREIEINILNIKKGVKDGNNYLIIVNRENFRGYMEHVINQSEFKKLQAFYKENI